MLDNATLLIIINNSIISFSDNNEAQCDAVTTLFALENEIYLDVSTYTICK